MLIVKLKKKDKKLESKNIEKYYKAASATRA